MSFVTTQPEALAYAAGKLQTLGSVMAAESAAAADPTTGVAPAAADEVSALQAAIFGAYGSLYQSVNAQATAIHELFVHTLGASAGSYTATESANSGATASPLSGGISGLLSSAANAASADPPGGNLANIFDIGSGNWGSATSDLLDMAQGGILPAANEDVAGGAAGSAAGAAAGLDGTVPTGAVGPAGSAGLGGRGSDVGGSGPGGLGRGVVGAAQLGRGGRRPGGGEPWCGNDRELDCPGAATHANDNHSSRHALGGHGRQSRRLGCAAIRRQAHRDGTAGGRLGTASPSRSQPINNKRDFSKERYTEMDFGALPPEINSGRMYAGPGAGPMMAAATAWNTLAAELNSAAAGYESVITELTCEHWLGPASASMVAAVQPYVAWLNLTAGHAQHAAMQATASAAAFETAFATTLPPPLIAANRAQLAALVATNFLGINTPAIMATEAHYAEMWAQDAAAMYGYAASSASAGTLTPMTPPRRRPPTRPGWPAKPPPSPKPAPSPARRRG